MIDNLLSIIAPHSCCNCGYLGAVLCLSCKNDIIFEPFERCIECLRPTAIGNLCDPCSTNIGIDQAWCVGVREGSVKALLNRLKFDANREAMPVCSELLLATVPLLKDVTIVPVPTAPAHRRVRGFDHTRQIARRFARKRGYAFSQVLQRSHNETQHFKSKLERSEAATRGLSVVGSVPDTVMLVDDIFTTGSTIRACTDALRSAGARTIYVALIARQTLDEDRDL